MVLQNRVLLSSGGVVLVYRRGVNVSPGATCGRGGAIRGYIFPLGAFLFLVSHSEAKKMGKGFYISKVVGLVGGILAVGAVATIIALSVVYVQEKAKNNQNVPAPTNAIPTTQPTAETPATAGTTTTVPTTPAPSNEPWDQYRLPRHLVPHDYNVTLWPRLTPDKDTGLYIFTGKDS